MDVFAISFYASFWLWRIIVYKLERKLDFARTLSLISGCPNKGNTISFQR